MPEATPVVPPTPITTPPVTPSGSDKAEKKVRGPAFAFCVEFAGSNNENILCPVDNHVCRGRWSRKNLVRRGAQSDGEFAAMPDLPGLCVVVNTGKRVIRRFDPLADPDNEKLLKRAQRIALAVTGTKMAPEKAKTWRERAADDNTLKTFCFWVLRLKDAGLVNVVKGRVPEFDEIRKLPGVIQLKQFDQLAGVVRGVPDDAIRYVKPVLDEDDEGRDEQFMDEIPDPVINAGDDDRDDD